MSNKTKKILKSLFIIAIMVAFLGLNIVYAATTSHIKFCDYGGVRRTFKIIGIVINIAKILVPMIIIITEIISITSVIISGKEEDLVANWKVLVKKIIAGLVIFILPTVIDFTIDSLVGYNDSGFSQCSNCLLDTSHCSIPTTDPETYSEE